MTIHEGLAEAWRAVGLKVVSVEPVSGKRAAPNPTAISLQITSSKTAVYQVFAWKIKHEGKGRTGNNLRIQATSFGKRNSPVQVDKSVLGVGWSEDHEVFVGFDPWVKRNPGSSSSVHIKRDLVEEAAKSGLALGGYTWDPRIAFTASNAAGLLPWAAKLWTQRTISVKASAVEVVDADHVRVAVDPWRSKSGWGVRIGDRIAVFDAKGKKPSQYLWRVQEISERPVVLKSGRNRFHYVFTAEKSAKVKGDLEVP